MIIERIVYCIVCLVLLGYIINKYLKTRSGMYLSLLAIQLVCILTQLIAFFSKIYVDIFMQLYILVFSIIIPAGVLIAECMNMNFEEFLEIKLGDFYARRAKYDKAIDRYKKAISKNNNNAQTFAKLGRIYNAKGDRRTAFDRFARAIEIDRNDYRSYYEIGVIFNDMGKQADAQIVLDNALRIKPDFTPASELLAVVLCAQNKYDEAINVYRNATRYDPDNYQLYYRMGVVRTELRDFNDAKECYEKAIELNPSLYEAYFSLGQINLLKGELEQAERMFKKSLVSRELTAKSYYQLAKVYILNDEEIKAVTYLGYAIDIDSSYKYKAESEPLFGKIKDYITGLSMANKVMQQAENIQELKNQESKRIYEGKKPKLVEGDVDEKIQTQEDTKNNSIDEVFKKDEERPIENKFLKVLKMVLGFEQEENYQNVKEKYTENNKKILVDEKNINQYVKNNVKVEDVENTSKDNDDLENIEEPSNNDANEKNINEVSKNDVDIAKIEEDVNESSLDDKSANEKLKESEESIETLDIFEKFKKLKKAEDEKAERLRRVQKLKQLEELNQEQSKQENKNISATINDDKYFESDEPAVVRTVGHSDSEVAREELRKLEELRKVRNFEIETKDVAYNDNSGKENFEDEDTMDEPHFDFMDRFKRK